MRRKNAICFSSCCPSQSRSEGKGYFRGLFVSVRSPVCPCVDWSPPLCVCACSHLPVHAHMDTRGQCWLSICLYHSLCVCMCACSRLPVHVHMDTRGQCGVSICLYHSLCVCMCVCVHIYLCTHTWTPEVSVTYLSVFIIFYLSLWNRVLMS